MPTATEFTIHVEDRPGTLGKLCRALGDRKVNIVAFQASPSEQRKSQLRLVVDSPAAARSVLDAEGLIYTETEVAQVSLPNRPGELGRAGARLAEANININYAYGGNEPETNAPLVILGVAEVGRVAKILDQAAAAASGG